MQDLSTNMVLLPGVSKMEFLRRIYMEKRKDTFSSPTQSPQRHSDSPTYQLQPQSRTKTSYSTYFSPHHHSSPSHPSQLFGENLSEQHLGYKKGLDVSHGGDQSKRVGAGHSWFHLTHPPSLTGPPFPTDQLTHPPSPSHNLDLSPTNTPKPDDDTDDDDDESFHGFTDLEIADSGRLSKEGIASYWRPWLMLGESSGRH